MRRQTQTLALVSILIATLVAASALYAGDSHEPSGSTRRGGMRGESKMMGGTSRMMNQCGAMMQGGTRNGPPNDQWRKDAPTTPDKDG